MFSLGLVLIWGGYTLGIWGYSKTKAAYNAQLALTLSDLTVPKNRTHFYSIAQQWAGAPGAGNPSAIPNAGAIQGNINQQQAANNQANQVPLSQLGTGIVPGVGPVNTNFVP